MRNAYSAFVQDVDRYVHNAAASTTENQGQGLRETSN